MSSEYVGIRILSDMPAINPLNAFVKGSELTVHSTTAPLSFSAA